MKRFINLFALVLVLSISLLPTAPALGQPRQMIASVIAARGQAIRDNYIVVLKPNGRAQAVLSVAGITARYTYDAVFNGFAAQLNAGQLNALQHNPNVAYIEQDQLATAATTQFMDANGEPWGLDRIDQHNLPLSGTYTYINTAPNVYAYIIDTGIQTSHPEFGGRAAVAYDALGGNGQDCNGHGTHVAGVVGGKTYGVAKAVKLRAVRVLNCSGSGSYSQIIAGVNWVKANHASPAVANMSLGGSLSTALNSAVASMISSGVVTAVSGGSSNSNACNFSPASVGSAITVVASDKTDHRTSFSNFGACVDLYAPGVGIKSAWLNGGVQTLTGTSMATAFVTGVEALCAAAGTPNCSIGRATPGVIISNPAGTPNKLLYMGGL